jgi:hypothetical protein
MSAISGSMISGLTRVAPVCLHPEIDMRVYPDPNYTPKGNGAAEAQRTVEYDPDTGVWNDTIRRTNIGSIQNKEYGGNALYRYRAVYFDGKQRRSGRLAWFFMTGKWPPPYLEVDHINGDALDDRWENLRLGTRQQQTMNTRGWSKSGYKGVAFHKASGRWRAHITIDGTQKSLGYYDTPEEAYAAYCKGAKEHFGEWANTGSMLPSEDEP